MTLFISFQFPFLYVAVFPFLVVLGLYKYTLSCIIVQYSGFIKLVSLSQFALCYTL